MDKEATQIFLKKTRRKEERNKEISKQTKRKKRERKKKRKSEGGEMRGFCISLYLKKNGSLK